MAGNRPPPRALPDRDRVMEQLVKTGGILGLTRTETLVLAMFAVGALSDWLGQWAEDDGLTMADVCAWLDQLAGTALNQDQS